MKVIGERIENDVDALRRLVQLWTNVEREAVESGWDAGCAEDAAEHKRMYVARLTELGAA